MKATPPSLGIRPEALAHWYALGAKLTDLAEEGRTVICCTDPNAWVDSDSPTRRREAAEACSWCPARRQCGAFAEANAEQAGVWGGVDRAAVGSTTKAAACQRASA